MKAVSRTFKAQRANVPLLIEDNAEHGRTGTMTCEQRGSQMAVKDTKTVMKSLVEVTKRTQSNQSTFSSTGRCQVTEHACSFVHTALRSQFVRTTSDLQSKL